MGGAGRGSVLHLARVAFRSNLSCHSWSSARVVGPNPQAAASVSQPRSHEYFPKLGCAGDRKRLSVEIPPSEGFLSLLVMLHRRKPTWINELTRITCAEYPTARRSQRSLPLLSGLDRKRRRMHLRRSTSRHPKRAGLDAGSIVAVVYTSPRLRRHGVRVEADLEASARGTLPESFL